MKGMLGLLEKAGFIQQKAVIDAPVNGTASDVGADPFGRDAHAARPNTANMGSSSDPFAHSFTDSSESTTGSGEVGHGSVGNLAPQSAIDQQIALSLDDIYAAAGVPGSVYPAEKLIRLLDGLKTMDDATRRTAVSAMDDADDGWTIQDPIADAAAKVRALQAHAQAVRAGVEQSDSETAALVSQVKERETTTVNDIRQQIAELEGLMAREIARSAQDQSVLEADARSKREHALAKIAKMSQTASGFTALVAQFGPSASDVLLNAGVPSTA